MIKLFKRIYYHIFEYQLQEDIFMSITQKPKLLSCKESILIENRGRHIKNYQKNNQFWQQKFWSILEIKKHQKFITLKREKSLFWFYR